MIETRPTGLLSPKAHLHQARPESEAFWWCQKVGTYLEMLPQRFNFFQCIQIILVVRMIKELKPVLRSLRILSAS